MSGKEEVSRQVLSDLQEELLQLEPGRPIPSHFCSPSLVEFLLQESEELQADAAESAILWADLAFHLADALRNKRFLACDAMARAARLKGNAFRLDGGLEAADRAFALGLMYLGDASPERPWFLRSLGILRWEQDRLAEGFGLLEHAAWLFSDLGLKGEEAACLSLAGLLWSETSKPGRGLAPLLHASVTERTEAPGWLRLRCGFLTAAFLGDLGSFAHGRTILDASMRLYSGTRLEGEILIACRLEGAARARLGDLKEGEHLLEGVRRKQLERRNVQEAALTSLALGALLAATGSNRKIRNLESEMQAAAFEPEAGGSFAVEALRSLQIDLRGGVRPWDAAARTGAEFLRLCRRFEVRLEPVPFL
jgi:hypothetical protein